MRFFLCFVLALPLLASAQVPTRRAPFANEQWVRLFNGKDLEGWEPVGHERWTVEDGTIHGQGLTKEYGYLQTVTKHRDFWLSLRFKCEDDGNSGVYFHTTFMPGTVTVASGMQFEIDRTIDHHNGGLYGDGRGWIAWPSPEFEQVIRPTDWNDLLLKVESNHMVAILNGITVIDFTDPMPKSFDGSIALQLHSGGEGNMRFKDIYVRDFPRAPEAPAPAPSTPKKVTSQAPALTPPAVNLTEAGQSRTLLVLPQHLSPSLLSAAEQLTALLYKVSGAKIGRVREQDLTGAVVTEGIVHSPRNADSYILLGDTQLTRSLGISAAGLKPGGYVMKTVGNALVLLGNDASDDDPDGTPHAVTAFLEEALGVRYLWPGELGLVIPSQPTIHLSALDVKSEPAIAQRRVRSLRYNYRVQGGLEYLGFTHDDLEKALTSTRHSKKSRRELADAANDDWFSEDAWSIHATRIEGSSTDASDDWFNWQKLGGTVGIRGGDAWAYTWPKYHVAHPEWFALQPNGSRDLTNLSPERSRLCKSNLQLIDALAADKIAELTLTGGRAASLCLNDGGLATFCQCDECKRLDDPNGRKVILWDRSRKPYADFEAVSLTDRHVWFWNQLATRIARVFPDVTLTIAAYSAYTAAPLHEKLDPHLAVAFISGSYQSDSARAQARQDWLDWSKLTSKIYWRPNSMLIAQRYGTPVVYVHKLADDLRMFQSHGMLGTDFDACQNCWATEGINYYVLARLLWDPTRDVDAIVADYCRAGFGAGAGSIQHYLARIEQLTDAIAKDPANQTVRDPDISAPYTPEVIAELSALLSQAEREASAEPVILKRIAFLRAGLDFTDLQHRTHALVAGYEHRPRELPAAQQKQLNSLLQEKWEMMRHMFYAEPMAVNVGQIAWSGEGFFRSFGFNGGGGRPEKMVEADANGAPDLPSATPQR